MEEMEKEFEELKKLAEPLQKWLTSNFNPMCAVVVGMDKTIILSHELSIPIEVDKTITEKKILIADYLPKHTFK